MAHADAADAFHTDIEAKISDRGPQPVKQRIAAFRHATGTEADADFGAVAVAAGQHRVHIADYFVPGRVEIVQHRPHGVGGEMAVGRVFNRDDGSEGATTEARDALDGELFVGCRVVTGRDVQCAIDRVVDVL